MICSRAFTYVYWGRTRALDGGRKLSVVLIPVIPAFNVSRRHEALYDASWRSGSELDVTSHHRRSLSKQVTVEG